VSRKLLPSQLYAKRAAGQMVAETVSSANGKMRAHGRPKSVISLRLSRAMLAALDVEVELRRDKQERAGRSWPLITRTTLIEESIAAVVSKGKR